MLSMLVNGSLFIPQVIRLLRYKDAQGLSLMMFAGFNIIQFSVIWHAYFQSDWALLIGTGFSFFTCGLITLLIVYFRYINKRGGC